MRKTLLITNLTVIVAVTAVAAPSLSTPRGAKSSPRGSELWVPLGVDPSLRAGPGHERVRVKVLAHRQPLLRAAARPRLRRGLDRPVPPRVRAAARRSPERITEAERRFARRVERRRSAAIRTLREPARRAVRVGARLRSAVRSAGGRVIGAGPLIAGVTALVPRSSLELLAAEPGVQAILPEPVERPQLDIAAQVIRATEWWSAGHTGGTGEEDVPGDDGLPAGAAVLNESPDPSHPAFTGVRVDNPPAPRITNHGTHTAGVIASQDGVYRGIAPGVDRLIGAGWADGSTWHESVAYAVGVDSEKGAGAVEPVRALSQSSGGGMPHDDVHATRDVVISTLALSVAAAAGNASSPSVGNGYENGLVVGAIDDRGTVDPSDDELASCFDPPTCSSGSSLGPTPGGRKKPDLVAPGQDIVSPELGGGFTAVSGTSYSAPMVGGALALLHGAGISDQRALRAILINSARDRDGQEHWEQGFGWGILDLERALAQRANWIAGEVEGGGARFYRATVPAGARATLAWERRGILSSWPGPVGGVVFGRANLDLHQYRGADLAEVPPPPDPGHGAGPDALSDNDTVEQVRAPAAGETIYKVRAASEVGECLVSNPPCEGDESEPFAIAAAAPLTQLVPPRVRPIDLSVSAVGTVSCLAGHGEVEVTARARNDSGDLAAGGAALTLELPDGVELIAGSATQPVAGGTLAPGATSAEHTWVVRASISGTKRLGITGTGGTMGETFATRRAASFEANCAPPAVLPVDSSRDPGGAVDCGVPVMIATRLRNPSALDAGDARVSLDLPTGVVLVEGPDAQRVAGGTLGAGETSDWHSWIVRQDAAGSTEATIAGEGVTLGTRHRDIDRVALECAPGAAADPPGPAAVRLPTSLDPDRLRLRRGRIVASGRVLAAGRPRGRVRVVARLSRGASRRPVRRRALARLGAAGRFRARIRVCRAGRWRLRARYLGTPSHAPSAARLGTVAARGGRLRC